MESDEDPLKDMAGWSDRRSQASNLPMAWPKKKGMPSPAGSGGRQSFSSSPSRLSVGNNGSNFSMEVTSPTEVALLRTPLHLRGSPFNRIDCQLPVTPQNEARVLNHVSSSTAHGNKNKTLPPLPGVSKKTCLKASSRAASLLSPIHEHVLFFNQSSTPFHTVNTSSSVAAAWLISRWSLM
ncbi:hypothetical protein BKA70DRAFT_1446798 [Coprinopsis sp. MPI-PUGE-AT-0042]|nr:hypothetical protein BKA70DRAFT_1446798 [Coprinopsis sp. MPI-PUGE-AT-0042]